MKALVLRLLPAFARVPAARARGEAARLRAALAVEGLDPDKRQITLRSPGGGTGTYAVSPVVRRPSEVQVGGRPPRG